VVALEAHRDIQLGFDRQRKKGHRVVDALEVAHRALYATLESHKLVRGIPREEPSGDLGDSQKDGRVR
jgi:hypothetical protein